MGGEETTPLLTPLLGNDDAAHADAIDTRSSPSRVRAYWSKAQHTVVPLVLDIVPDTALGLLVQYSRDDPGARILTAFTFASIVQSQVVATLQLALRDSLDARRAQLKDPLKRRELWVLAQAAWVVYMAYLPLAGLACGYTAWRSREAIFGQNADVADVVASLLVINLISLPFSLGSALLRSELDAQKVLKPFVVAFVVSWTVGLSFAYLLGYWTPLGFVGIASTDIITYGIQFRMLAPETRLLTEWPGWHFREALALVPRVSCHPAMVATLLVNLSVMLFGFTSLLASLIKVDVWVQEAQANVFPSLLMLSFMPLLSILLFSSTKIKLALAIAYGHADAKPTVQPLRLAIAMVLLTAFATASWLIGALSFHAASLPPSLVEFLKATLSVLVPAFPPVGFVLAIRPVLRTCISLWREAGAVFVVTMAGGALLGDLFAEDLDGGIQGLWYGQFLSVVAFVAVAALSVRRWTVKLATPAPPTLVPLRDPEPTQSARTLALAA